MILIAVIDTDYSFVVIDIDSYDSIRDNGVHNNSLFGRAMDNGTLDLPSPKIQPEAEYLGSQPLACWR